MRPVYISCFFYCCCIFLAHLPALCAVEHPLCFTVPGPQNETLRGIKEVTPCPRLQIVIVCHGHPYILPLTDPTYISPSPELLVWPRQRGQLLTLYTTRENGKGAVKTTHPTNDGDRSWLKHIRHVSLPGCSPHEAFFRCCCDCLRSLDAHVGFCSSHLGLELRLRTK